MSPEIYSFLERASPLLILWSFGFTLLHAVRIVRRASRMPRGMKGRNLAPRWYTRQ